MYEKTHEITKKLIIALYNIEFKVFRFKNTEERIKGFDTFVKNRFINVYNNDDNLCIFACLAYHFYSEDYIKAKGNVNNIHRLDIKVASNFYKFVTDNEDWKKYKGFNTIKETEELGKFFKINILYFSYKEETKQYKRMDVYHHNYEITLNILLHTGIDTKGNIINHVMLITNIEKLTGLIFCSKYGKGFKT
jgi:hypothetical protein